MGWKVKVENATADNGFPAVTIDAVIGPQRVSIPPGASGTLSGPGSGQMTLNAQSTSRQGVTAAWSPINVLGDFSDFTCKVTLPSGTALRLQVTAQ